MLTTISRLKKRTLVLQSAGSLIAKVFQALAALALSILLAKALSPEDIGTYGMLLGIMGILTIPVQAGVARFLYRAVAKTIAEGKEYLVSEYIAWARWSAFFATAASAVILLCLSFFLKETWPNQSPYMIAIIPAVALTMFMRAEAGALIGLRYTVTAQSMDLVRNAIMLLLIFAIFISAREITITTVIIILAVGSVGSLLLAGQRLRQHTKPRKHDKEVKWTYCWKEMTPFLLTGSVTIFVSRIDIILIGWISGASEAGFFHISSQFGGLMLFGLSAIQIAVAPRLIELHTKREGVDLQGLVIKAIISSLGLGLICAAFLLLSSEFIIETLYGSDYLPAATILTVLTLAHLLQSVGGIFTTLLSASGHIRHTLRSVLIASAAKMAAAPILMIHFGAVGAAWSLVIYSGALLLLQAHHSKKSFA